MCSDNKIDPRALDAWILREPDSLLPPPCVECEEAKDNCADKCATLLKFYDDIKKLEGDYA